MQDCYEDICGVCGGSGQVPFTVGAGQDGMVPFVSESSFDMGGGISAGVGLGPEGFVPAYTQTEFVLCPECNGTGVVIMCLY